MNILYCGDKNIEKGLIISCLSLLKHIDEKLNIYVLTINFDQKRTGSKLIEPVTDKCIEALNNRVKEKNLENFVKKIDITDLFEKEIPHQNMKTHFTPCCMLRLFADEIEEMPNKILYLDTDVVCRQNFSEFYHQDMKDVEFARCFRLLWKMVF